MINLFYRASFFLYEISFILFSVALFFQGVLLNRLARALKIPRVGIFPLSASVLFFLCAATHFYVYHFLSPQYMQTNSFQLLLLMYSLKTFTMISIFVAGICIFLGNAFYLKKTGTFSWEA
jgi:hypothetical protein